MMSRLKDFASRHKKKFIITGLLIGGTMITVRYAQKKLREYQEKQTRDFFEKSKRLQHFDSTQRTCNDVIIGLSTKICNDIINIINTSDTIEKLRKTTDTELKIELWDELKISSFTRLTTLIYATSMLAITMRIQLNLLGGYLYKDVEFGCVSEKIRQEYLSSIQYFLSDGLVKLIGLIKEKVRHILKTYKLSQKLTLSDLEQIFFSIQMAINCDVSDPNGHMADYVLSKPVNDGTLLIKMFTETEDILESDDVITLCSNNICRGFSIATDYIAENMNEILKNADEKTADANKNNSNDILNLNQQECPLAKLIPIICGTTGKSIDSNEKPQTLATNLVSFYLVTEKIKTLGENVYEVFSI